MNQAAIDDYIAADIGADRLTRNCIDDYTLRYLNQTLAHCRNNSPFYHYLPEHLDSLEGMAAIPTMNADDLTKHNRELVLVSQSEIQRVVTDQTSGTTAAAKRLFYTAEDQSRTVDHFVCGLSEMVAPGDRTLICMPSEQPGSLGDLIARAITRLGATPTIFGIGKTFAELLRTVKINHINTVVAMPIPMVSFGRYANALGEDIRFKNILLGADAATTTIGSTLTDLFNCGVYPHYGSREMGLSGATSCPAHEDMHLRENDLYVEILDPFGNLLPDGVEGEIVFTTLRRRAMPLVRYRTGDLGRINPTPCPCGSVVKRIGSIRRLSSFPVTMSRLDDLLFQLPSILDYRADLDGDQLTLRIVCTAPITEDTVRHCLSSCYSGTLKIHVEPFDIQKSAPLYVGKRHLSIKTGA